MQFRTEIPPLRGHEGVIVHGRPVWTIGSCFAENIGKLLRADLFDVRVNPFGAVYNPASIAALLNAVTAGEEVSPDEFFCRDGAWVSFRFHSAVSGTTPQEAADKANRIISGMREELPRLGCVAITLGSVFTFTHNESGRVATNCHKQPASLFTLGSLSLDQTTELLRESIAGLRAVNPELNVILTVSPVRHLAYGFQRDKRSKATLILAAGTLEEEGTALYFPAYEAVLDDLRDYRFYGPDMTHPSEQAALYVYDLFANSFFNPATRAIAEEARAYSRLAAHRPTNPERHATMLAAAREKLLAKHPQLTTPLDNLDENR